MDLLDVFLEQLGKPTDPHLKLNHRKSTLYESKELKGTSVAKDLNENQLTTKIFKIIVF